MKKWRLLGIILLAFALLLAGYLTQKPQAKEVDEPVRTDWTDMEALEALIATTGAEVVDGEAQFFAILTNSFSELEKLEEILLDVAALLEITEGNVEKSEGPTYRVLDLLGKSRCSTQTHVVVQSNPGDEETLPPQTYLLVICRDQSVEVLKNAVDVLSEALQPYAANGQISFYLTGEIAGKLTDAQMVAAAKHAIAAVSADIVEGIEEKELVSYTAYTPLLKQHVTVDSERFNVNIAIRYDDFHQKTIVWAGFPIIHDPY